MRWTILLLCLCCAREEAAPAPAPSAVIPRASFAALHCGGSGSGDWRFSAHMKEVLEEVAREYGSWIPCHSARVVDECRQDFGPDCLRTIGADNDVEFGLRIQGRIQGTEGTWTAWLYDLRSGELHQSEELECGVPCTEGRAESTYRDVLHRVFGSASR